MVAVQIAPVYYVTGNHEEDLSLPKFYRLINGIEEAGGVVLDSEFAVISRSEGIIYRGDDSVDFDEASILENSPDDIFALIGLADKNLFHQLHHAPLGQSQYTPRPPAARRRKLHD